MLRVEGFALRAASALASRAAFFFVLIASSAHVVTQSTQDADNRGDDENKPSQVNPVTVEVPITK